MKTIQFSQINLFEVGTDIQLFGAIYASKDKLYLLPLPDEKFEDISLPAEVLKMDSAEWEKFLRQTDLVEVIGPEKAILRKSQRQIDTNVQWEVYRKANFLCEYCGEAKPLTVDHVICWESGGSSTVSNLKSACRRCNKLRGNMSYGDWIFSEQYKQVSSKLPSDMKQKNLDLINELPRLEKLKVNKQRSR